MRMTPNLLNESCKGIEHTRKPLVREWTWLVKRQIVLRTRERATLIRSHGSLLAASHRHLDPLFEQ